MRTPQTHKPMKLMNFLHWFKNRCSHSLCPTFLLLYHTFYIGSPTNKSKLKVEWVFLEMVKSDPLDPLVKHCHIWEKVKSEFKKILYSYLVALGGCIQTIQSAGTFELHQQKSWQILHNKEPNGFVLCHGGNSTTSVKAIQKRIQIAIKL